MEVMYIVEANSIKKQTVRAMKWSSITEILAKLISPVINMLLARILSPEAFGVLATVIMVISFAEVFVESGFQKFLIQHNFDSIEEEKRFMSVAFWANLIFSCIIWLLIIIFCEDIATVAGNRGLGITIAVTGLTIPLYGIIGIQNCKLKKELEFKGLFYVRITAAVIPLVVTLPLAIIGLDYWSLIIGNIAGVLVQSVLLVVIGKFKPDKYFSFTDLKYMLGFGIWTLLDGIATWATAWIDTLLISRYMSAYYLGLYKNSISTITALFTMITAALTPVLFSSLSKLQNQQEEFNDLFSKVQRMLCTFLLPLSIGLFCYRDFATVILFGNRWLEAANIIGIMSVTIGLRTVFVSFYSDLYRAKGKFYIPLILQIIDLAIIVPTCLLAVRAGFWSLVYARAFVKLDLIIPDLIVSWYICGLSPLKTLKSLLPTFASTGVMTVVIFFLQSICSGIVWNIISIVICVIVYFGVILLFQSSRKELLEPFIKKFKGNNLMKER